jgi:hypothetical protein
MYLRHTQSKNSNLLSTFLCNNCDGAVGNVEFAAEFTPQGD